MNDPRAGTPGPALRPGRRRPPGHRVLHPGARPGRRRPAGRLRHVGSPRQQPAHRVQRDAHPGHDAGDLRLPQGAGLRRPAVHRPRHPRPVRAGLGDGARGAGRQRRHGAGRRPRRLHARPRPSRTRSCAPTAARRWTGPASPTASWSRRRTTRPPTAASSTTRRTAARPTPTPPASSPTAPTPSSRPASTACAGSRSPGRGPPRGPTTSWAPTSTTCPSVVDLDRIREAGVRIGADPLGGASVAYWGEIAERHGLDLTVVNPLVDPTWRFMTLDWDGKIRMDCSSPSAMASLIGAQGRVRHRHRQRRRRRPARHRHPRRRADEPQPLPRRRDPVPLRRRPPAVADVGRDRQDAGVLLDDRPGRRGGRPRR